MSVLFELIESFGPILEGAGTIFWIWMLFDCSRRAKVREYRGWILLLLFFTHWIGALIYFFIYVYPLTNLLQFAYPVPPLQRQPSAFYTAPKQPTEQEYQQGYQAQSSFSTSMPSTNSYYQPSDQQGNVSQLDYEEPQATYPEMPLQEQ